MWKKEIETINIYSMSAKPIRIAINGFGRIGRILTRVVWDNPAFEIVAINSTSTCDVYAHLIKYDSIYGVWGVETGFSENDDALIIDGKSIPFLHERNIEDLNWGEMDVDIVIESTGVFRDRVSTEKHIKSGAKHVLISAPAKEEDITMIYGINHELFDPAEHKIVSAASCTTTCLAPVVKVLNKAYGIKHGTVITTHSYTNDQHLVDHPHKKKSFRRSRAAGLSIIPTETGAAKAIGKVIPEMKGKLDGNALRVPIPTTSIISFIAELEKETDRDAVNAEFERAVKEDFPGNVDVSKIGLVSVDYVGSPYASTIDTLSTLVTDGTQVFVQAWYDNEWGYVEQMVKLIEEMGKKIHSA